MIGFSFDIEDIEDSDSLIKLNNELKEYIERSDFKNITGNFYISSSKNVIEATFFLQKLQKKFKEFKGNFRRVTYYKIDEIISLQELFI